MIGYRACPNLGNFAAKRARTSNGFPPMNMPSALRRSPRLAFATAFLAACTHEPTGTFDVTTGGEADALSRTPAPTTLVVETLRLDGTKTELSRTALPATSLSLGSQKRTDVGALVVRALDDEGHELLHGETLFLQFGALESTDVSVFIQRNGEFARLPNPFSNAFTPSNVGLVLDRYVLAVDDTKTATKLYDLQQLAPLLTSPSLARPARSLVTYGTVVVAIDENGASAVDVTTQARTEINAPSGGTFAEVAGGKTVTLGDGSSYVVGGTRTDGDASARVLRVGADGKLSFSSLITPRKGACAAWVQGRGLLVVGGSASGAGLEIVDATTQQASALAYPSDPVSGCGVGALDQGHALVAGGTLPSGPESSVRTFDLSCAANCAPVVGSSSPPLALVRADVATMSSSAALIVGDDASGTTRAYRSTSESAVALSFRVPHEGGQLVRMPTGGVAVFGGAAAIEQYRE